MLRPFLRIFFGLLLSCGFVLSLFFVYDIFVLRGRGSERVHFWFVPQTASESYWLEGIENKDLVFHATMISEDQCLLTVKNTGFTPYYFLAYEYEGWQFSLPDEKMLNYAQRVEMQNKNGLVVSPASHGFDCGTGLGYTLIRPKETFSHVYPVTELRSLGYPMHYVRHVGDTKLVDLLTGTTLEVAPELDWRQRDSLLCAKLPPQDFRVRFSFRVQNYWTGAPSYVYSSPLELSREELIDCGWR